MYLLPGSLLVVNLDLGKRNDLGADIPKPVWPPNQTSIWIRRTQTYWNSLTSNAFIEHKTAQESFVA